MQKPNFRMERVNAYLKRLMSEIIAQELNAPNDFVSVVDINTTRDLSLAKIYISALKNVEDYVEHLNKISARLRYLITPKLHLKKIPQLKFLVDIHGENILETDRLIEKNKKSPIRKKKGELGKI